MILYEKKNMQLNVYDFSANEEEIINYKKDQMQTIDENSRVFTAESYVDSRSDYKLYDITNPTHMSIKDQEEILKEYYEGHLDNRPVVNVGSKEENSFYLFSNPRLSRPYYDRNKKTTENIIRLPESLFKLQLIIQNSSSLLQNFDSQEQLELFRLTLLETIDLLEMIKMDRAGITDGIFQKSMKKVENDELMLLLKRKDYVKKNNFE